jgi:hypothetical protein
MSRSCTSSSPKRLRGVIGKALALTAETTLIVTAEMTLIVTAERTLIVCPSTALVRDPAEVLPKAVYELGVSALNLVHVFGIKRCVVNSNTLFRTERNSV